MSQQASRIKRLERDDQTRARVEAATASLATYIPDDPVALARQLGIEPDAWQRDLLTAKDEYIILNCARQSGKSTIVAILALHHAMTKPKSLILILSRTQRQSGELLRKVMDFYTDLGRPLGSHASSAAELHLGNGSRVVALPGSEATTRGFSAPSLVLVDEAATVSDELYLQTVRPMLAVSRGRLILLSTPRGKQGFFWRAWSEEQKKVKVTAYENPRVTPEHLEAERRVQDEYRFRQEYLCEFTQVDEAIFKESSLRYYDTADLPAMDTIVQSWDPAATAGETSDYTVGQVWGRKGDDFYLIYQVRGKWNFDEIAQAIAKLDQK